jgi:uncharacterized membrane protein YgcG
MKKIFSFFAIMLISGAARARVAVHDSAGIIPQSQQDALIAEGSRWPFDLHVLTGAFPSPAALDTAVHRCITAPNVVCIGIDPVHHKTNIHVGTATGIPASDGLLSSVGNSYFKDKDYQGGIEAIAGRARALATTVVPTPIHNTPVYTVQQPVQVHIDSPASTGMSTGWWLFLFFMIALAGIVVYYVRRAVKTAKKVNEDMNDFRDEAFEMSSRNMEERDFHEKLKAKITTKQPMAPAAPITNTAPVAPARVVTTAPNTTPGGSTTVVHNHISGSGSGASTGDMLLAYELGRISNPTQVVVAPNPVVHEVVRETIPADSGGSSSNWDTKADDNDSGGSSSSWDSGSSDSGSSDSGSSDSGSSSSDWGGGGGDSGGGGGSDSGGGGSDW